MRNKWPDPDSSRINKWWWVQKRLPLLFKGVRDGFIWKYDIRTQRNQQQSYDDDNIRYDWEAIQGLTSSVSSGHIDHLDTIMYINSCMAGWKLWRPALRDRAHGLLQLKRSTVKGAWARLCTELRDRSGEPYVQSRA